MKASYWILGSLFLAGAAHAQTDQSQLVQPQAASQLNSNLARLASNPRDVTALIGAGEAALELDDARAAAGFFARADAVTPNNGRVKAGLGRVMLKLQNPAEALRQFDLAGKAGYPEATILSDRALAKDMTGDQAGAQRDYQTALRATPNDDELVRRYAASLGISGQVEASDKVLQPLLYKSDRAAWRYRAFVLAMNNRQAEAKKIADQTLPAQLAAAIVPYMQKMPYLTGAQKAAALHFGHFPQQVGTSIAAVVPTPPAPVGNVAPPVAATSTLASAEPRNPSASTTNGSRNTRTTRDRDTQTADSRTSRRSTRMAQPDTRAPTSPATVQPVPTRPAPTTPSPQPKPMVQPTPSQPTVAQPSTATTTPRPTPMPSSSAPVQGPPNVATEFSRPPSTSPSTAVAQASPSPASSSASQPTAPVPRQQPDPAATRTLADIIRAIDVPDAERQQRVAAVDLSEVAAMQAARRAQQNSAAEKAKQAALAKAKAEAAAKAKKEAEEKKRLADNPSRNWLQVGTGASKGALAFTMKGLRKKYDSLARQDAWTAGWGRTNRLLVGPFPSFARARTLESKLKGAGADVFAWQSDAGEVVEKLGSD